MSCKKRFVRFSALYTLGAVASLVGCSAGDERPTSGNQDEGESFSVVTAKAPLKATHPIVNSQTRGDKIRRIHGVAATGKTPAAAAESFRQRHAMQLGVHADELAATKLNAPAKLKGAPAPSENGVGLMYNPATGKYKFRLFNYQQQRDGIPVFRAGLRTLVREDGDHPVVWANADLRPMGNFKVQPGLRARAVDLEKSLQAVRTSPSLTAQAIPMPRTLTNVSAPTQTIFAGTGDASTTPQMAMQYTAQDANGPGKWTFVADATTGDILHVESNLHFNVTGNVQGQVITGPEAMECGTLGNAALAHANVTSAAGNAITDSTGAFTIVQSGTGTVTVKSDVTGKYFTVSDAGGSSHTMSLNVTPPGPANFLHRDTETPPEQVLAQLNAYKASNDIRDLLLRHVPEYPVIAAQTNFQINVNLTDQLCDRTGGAWYYDDGLPRTLNFCRRTSDRANTAFRSIVHHEYGHHVIDSAGSGQAEYGEGMADTIAMLFSKDPRIGIGYHLNQCNEPLRNAASTCQYAQVGCSSCGSGIYECGSLISGTIWDIWKQLEITDPTNADDIIRSLVFSSIPMHSGTSINESIAVDLLTLDDDDGLLENGTPHYAEICAGFYQHGMNCPALVDGLVVKGLDFVSEGPSDGPYSPTSVTYTLHNLGPQQSLAYSVKTPADARWLSVDSTGGTIALGQSATITATIDQAQAALLADGSYSAAIEFVNETSGVGTKSLPVKLRVGAPEPIYTATFANGLEGFTIDNEIDNPWHQSTACADSRPGHTAPGSLYYGKDSACNFAVGNPTRHTITSPAITIGKPGMAELGFKYVLQTENSSEFDRAEVLISVDGGPFQVVASNNNGGQKMKETNAWQELRFDISGLLPVTGPTSIRIQLAFHGVTIYENTKTGFVIDDITVYAQPSAAGGPCTGYCTNPITFTSKNYQSGNLGSNATCYETTAALTSGVCGNFVSPRKLFVNGVEKTCNWASWSSLPPVKNGGYCIYTTAGNQAWASFSTW